MRRALKQKPLQLANVLVWRNDTRSPTHDYAPYPGQGSVNSFLRLRQDPYIGFRANLYRRCFRLF